MSYVTHLWMSPMTHLQRSETMVVCGHEINPKYSASVTRRTYEGVM